MMRLLHPDEIILSSSPRLKTKLYQGITSRFTEAPNSHGKGQEMELLSIFFLPRLSLSLFVAENCFVKASKCYRKFTILY